MSTVDGKQLEKISFHATESWFKRKNGRHDCALFQRQGIDDDVGGLDRYLVGRLVFILEVMNFNKKFKLGFVQWQKVVEVDEHQTKMSVVEPQKLNVHTSVVELESIATHCHLLPVFVKGKKDRAWREYGGQYKQYFVNKHASEGSWWTIYQ